MIYWIMRTYLNANVANIPVFCGVDGVLLVLMRFLGSAERWLLCQCLHAKISVGARHVLSERGAVGRPLAAPAARCHHGLLSAKRSRGAGDAWPRSVGEHGQVSRSDEAQYGGSDPGCNNKKNNGHFIYFQQRALDRFVVYPAVQVQHAGSASHHQVRFLRRNDFLREGGWFSA